MIQFQCPRAVMETVGSLIRAEIMAHHDDDDFWDSIGADMGWHPSDSDAINAAWEIAMATPGDTITLPLTDLHMRIIEAAYDVNADDAEEANGIDPMDLDAFETAINEARASVGFLAAMPFRDVAPE